MNLTKLAGVFLLLCTTSVWAIEPFTVSDIRVEGIQRTEAGTVFSYLPVKVGDRLDNERAASAIHALFSTGFFKDVRLKVDHGVLIVKVRERPSIASIEINGITDFPKQQLKDNMKFAGLAEARIFDKGALEKAVQELKRQYVARGKYGVKVSTTVTELERNRVGVVFNVIEGDVSKIKQINLIGNQAYPEEELLDMMKLSTPGWFTWLTNNDQYSKPKLSADIETLRSFYMDNGYLEFNIESTQVSITPDKKDIYITINFSEGKKYTVARVDISGEIPLPKEEIEKLVMVKTGDVFSRKVLAETSNKITERFGQEGYAFANVNAVPDIDKENHLVSFNFLIDPAQRTYIRRINIAGNTKTRDEVIRREFRQTEGEWFDMEKVKKSKQRVDRLNFFGAVNVETPPVQGAADQMDINVTVEEKPTGNISAGAGFSSGEGLVLTGGVTQANLFGTGNHLSTQINTGKVNQVYSVSYTNPYYTDDGVSRGFDLYKRNTDSSSTTISQYSTHTLGGGVRFGVPIADEESISLGLAVERTELGLYSTPPARLQEYVDTFGATNTNLLATIGWGRDNRDSAIYTTEGTAQRAVAEFSLPVYDMRYYKLNYQQQVFYPINNSLTLLLNGELGYADGYDGKPLPFFKNFYSGGPGSVRGYETSSLGPRDATDSVLGGNSRIVGNLELLMPFPGMEKVKSTRLSGFLDAGAVYGKGDLPGSAGLRSSYGVAFTWLSPVGPLKFSYAWPINPQTVDRVQNFQFTLGQMF